MLFALYSINQQKLEIDGEKKSKMTAEVSNNIIYGSHIDIGLFNYFVCKLEVLNNIDLRLIIIFCTYKHIYMHILFVKNSNIMLLK